MENSSVCSVLLLDDVITVTSQTTTV